MLLVAVAIVAVVWANSPWREAYLALWDTPVGLRVGSFTFERSLQWFVNDVLMVVFFFVVGLEIRREIHEGELSEWRRAALPVIAAMGGMVVPALIYVAIAGAPSTVSGWGVPMATDIAFAVGILSILGTRVPPALRVLLLALAVIDDLGAILVIAVFYSGGVVWAGIGVALASLGAIVVMQRAGVRASLAYVPPAAVAWAGTYAAGFFVPDVTTADVNGDGRADVRKVLFAGWGTGDTHAGPSNLTWGLDGWIYGMVGYSGFSGFSGAAA